MEATSSVPELRAVQQQQLHHPIVAQRVDTSTAHEDATRLIVHTSTFAAISTAKIRLVTITLTVQRERIIGMATHQPIGSRHPPFPPSRGGGSSSNSRYGASAKSSDRRSVSFNLPKESGADKQ